jgi:hypothetical protein
MIADMTLTVPMSWKIIHAFVSSTIRDIHAGGDHLVRDVFPTRGTLRNVHRDMYGIAVGAAGVTTMKPYDAPSR